jgi:hypothetical protein
MTMDEIEPTPPSALASVVAEAIVSTVCALVIAKAFKARAPKGVVLGVVAIAVHTAFDAPVARVLSKAGL